MVQDDATDQLHIVRHHVPLRLMTPHGDSLAEQATARLPHRRIGLRQDLAEHGLHLLAELLLQLPDPQRHTFALQGFLSPLLLLLERGYFLFERLRALADY